MIAKRNFHNRFLSAALVLWGTGGAWFPAGALAADTLQDPIAILRKASETVKAAKVIQYQTTVQPFGTTKPTPARLEGSVLFGGWKDRRPAKFKYDIQVMALDSSGGKRITLGCDGESHYLVDHDAKKVYVGKSIAVFGSYENAYASFPIIDLVRPQPLENELVSGTAALKGVSKVGDEDCYELQIDYTNVPANARVPPPTEDKALWFISAKSFLVRRLDKVSERPSNQRLGRQVMLTDFVLDPKFADDPFALKVPEGFTRVDQPAP